MVIFYQKVYLNEEHTYFAYGIKGSKKQVKRKVYYEDEDLDKPYIHVFGHQYKIARITNPFMCRQIWVTVNNYSDIKTPTRPGEPNAKI